MKVAIIGKDSYIGNAIQEYILKEYQYDVVQFDVQNCPIESFDFSDVDTVVHVAAIVHRPDVEDYSVYKKVNTDLPYNTAILAKKQGVKHFVS